jgi:hypothetical protein
MTLSSSHYPTVNVPHVHLLPEHRPQQDVSLPPEHNPKLLACCVLPENLSHLISKSFHIIHWRQIHQKFKMAPQAEIQWLYIRLAWRPCNWSTFAYLLTRKLLTCRQRHSNVQERCHARSAVLDK